MDKKYKKILNVVSQYSDLIIIAVAAIVIYILAFTEGMYVEFYTFSNSKDSIELNGIFTILTAFSLLLGLFYFSKWKRLKKEIANRKKVEESLRNSKDQYKDLFESAHDAIVILRPEDEVVLNVNERACEIYGFNRAEFIGRSIVSLTVDLSRGNEQITKTLQKGFYHSFETIQRRKDGSEMFLEINASAIKYNGQDAIISINRDVTERKKIEQAYKESEERFKALVNNSSDVILILDENICCKYLSPSFEILTGFKVEEKLGNPLMNDIHPEDRPKLIEIFNRGIRTDINKERPFVEFRYKKKNGEYIYTESGGLSLLENPYISGIIVNTRDITERKKTEKELLLYSHAIRNISDGVIITNLDNKIIFVNQAFTKIYGYTYEEVINQHASILAHYEDELFNSITQETLIKGWQGELLNKKKDGKVFPIELSTSAIRDDKKEIVGLIGVFKDISERKDAEEKLKVSEQKYRLLAENSTDMIYIYSLVPEPHYQYISPSCETMTGYTAEEGYADPFIYHNSLVTPEDVERFNEYLFSPDAERNSIKERWRKKDGEFIWVEQVISRNFDEEGNLLSFQSTVRDVTSNYLAEQALLESETHFRNLYENATLGLFQFTFAGKILMANPAFINIIGYDFYEELKNIDLNSSDVFVNPNERKEIKRILEAEDIITGFEVEWHRKDKSVIYVRLNGRAVKNKKNKIIYIECTIEDITERKIAEEKLRESERRFKSLYENATIGIFRTTPEGQILLANQAFVKLIGYSSEKELKAQNLNKAKIYYDLNRRKQFLKEIAEKNVITGFEAKWYKKDGSIIYVLINARAHKDEKGNIVHFDGTLENITERRKSLEVITKLSTAIEQSPLSILITDSKGIIEYINPAGVITSGYSMEDLKDKTPRVFKSEQTDKKTYEDLWSTIKSGKIWTGELLNKRKNGELYWEDIVISPIYDSNQILSNFVAIREDVNEKKKNEKELADYRERLEYLVEERTTELRQSEEKFKVLAENSEDVIMRFDRNLTWLYVNPAVEKLGNFRYQELLDKTLYDLEFAGNIKTKLIEGLLKVFKTGMQTRFEFQFPNRLWVDWIAVPEFSLEGEVYNVITFARDITGIKESEQKINEALQKEKELNDFKSKFISTASHQFRTPLSSILSSSQMIKRYAKKWDEDKLNEHHSRIGNSIKNLTQIMDDLLTISKTEEGRYTLKLEELNLEDSIQKLISEVENVYEKNKRIKFINKSKNKLFKTDKKLFSEIVNNLLTNAIKYSPLNEKIIIKTKDINEYLEISIKDKGIGISKNDQKYIFNAFYRAKNGFEFQGTGLGLNIVKRGVELLNGIITLKSELGKGTEIIVRLPITLD